MQERASVESRRIIQRLAKTRTDRGLTQAYVAKKMGTTQPYIARLESAQNDPRLSTVLRYALIVAGAAVLAAIVSELERQGKR